MSWYTQSGNESDVVIYSKIRLSRNIKGIPFPAKCNEKELEEVYNKMKEISYSLGYGLKFIDLNELDAVTRQSLVEKHVLSNRLEKEKGKYRAIIINEEEKICIEINGEDHIALQVLCSGLDLNNILNLAIEIDEKIQSTIPYAYHEKYGYLTACPIYVGTGLKASIQIHIPGLSITNNTRKIINIVNNLGMNIRSSYGDGQNYQGDFYQISNNQTLGITEEEIIKNLNLIIQKVKEQERTARKFLAKNSIDLEDRIYRDFGVITNARKLDQQETLELLSSIKLGNDLGIINELNDLKMSKLMIYTKPANLQKRIGKKLSSYEQSIERANIVRQIIEED